MEDHFSSAFGLALLPISYLAFGGHVIGDSMTVKRSGVVSGLGSGSEHTLDLLYMCAGLERGRNKLKKKRTNYKNSKRKVESAKKTIS